jgi:methionyl aminopeptidase
MRPKSDKEIELMREGGKELARILNKLAAQAVPGASGRDIASSALSEVKLAGLQPILLGYEGFPDAICVSVNDAIVHGIPIKDKFKEGDVVKLDLTVAHKGMVVDSALTVVVGSKSPSADVKRLLDGSKRSLLAGIDAIKGDGTRVGDISAAVQEVLDKNKLGIVKDLVGHGVGYGVHEEPNIPNYGVRGTGPVLMSGMTIAIEPMATLGDWRVDFLKDGWTVVSRDGTLSAHFEHTVLITDDGAEILTSL